MTRKPTKRASENPARPAWAARLAAARLRRAFEKPILAAPPARAIQAWFQRSSGAERKRMSLNNRLKSCMNYVTFWLVLTRTSLAGFNAPIDTAKGIPLASVIM